MPKSTTENYWYVTKSNRNGFIVILVILVLITTFPFIYHAWLETAEPEHDYSAQIATLRALQPDTSNNYEAYAADHKPYQQYTRQQNFDRENATVSMFYFDPNTISVEDWKRLGVKEKTALSVQKYISKGGKFRQPEDIKKIWGISPDKMNQLVPYVRITSVPVNAPNNNYPTYTKTEYQPYEKKKVQVIDINNADTIGFATLPGIGPGYARRIAKFRDRLGGFYSVEQVAETFGLPDSTFQKAKPYLQVNAAGVHKLNINSSTEEELKAHPYIRWQYAKLIVAYRGQHGNFKAVEDLQNIMALTPADYAKIRNYVTVQ